MNETNMPFIMFNFPVLSANIMQGKEIAIPCYIGVSLSFLLVHQHYTYE